MIRLRFPSRLPPTLDAGAALEFSLWAANESGSQLALSTPLALTLALVDYVSCEPLRSATPPTLRIRDAVIAPSGAGVVRCSIAWSGARPVRVRLCISAAKPAQVLPPRGAGSAGGSSSSSSSGSKAAPLPCAIPVLTAYSAVVTVVPTSALMPSAAPLSAAAAALDRSTCEAVRVRLVPPPSSPASAAIELLLLEEHMRVTTGFGSIIWDGALAMCSALSLASSAPRAAAASRMRVAKAAAKSPAAACVAATPEQRAARALTSWTWAGARVVDLGTGTGVVGLVAASLGARVVLTDLPQLLPLAAANAAAAAAQVRKAAGEVLCAPLVWGEAESWLEPPCAPLAAAAEASGGATRTGSGVDRRPLLTASGRLSPPYDAILASEVAYRPEAFPLIVDTLCRLLAPTGGAAATAAAGAAAGDAETAREPLVFLAARQRACCDINDFIEQLAMHFDVVQLTAAASAAAQPAGAPAAPPLREDVARLPLLPEQAASIIAWSRACTKQACPPMLFVLLPRQAARGVPLAGGGK